ncbi:MAG TPA: type VI secretion system baseplate subunit TssE [Chthoniobacteraceae bacterium]
MPVSSPIERLQPCLFDRLIDESPENHQESRTQRIISLARYREGVLRDLIWLLNCSAHTEDEGLGEFPEVEKSAFNFGKHGLSGLVASSLDPGELEAEIARAVRQFEPRIVKGTLVVRAISDEKSSSPNILTFEISGELWAQPFPEKLFIKTALDVENGTIVS